MFVTPSLRQSIRLLLLGDFFLLPFAHLKLSLWDLPFYILEIPILIAFFLFLYELVFRRSTQAPSLSHRHVIIGTCLFLFGAILSFVSNPFSWTGLGMIKSWFFIPIAAAFLWRETGKDKTENIFIAWALSSLLIAIGSLWFLINNLFTYDHRLEAWYTSPNFLAILVAPGILFVSFFFESLRAKKGLGSTSLFLILSALSIVSLVLFLTRSYAVWAATFFSLLFFLSPFITGKNIRKKLLLMFCLIIGAGTFIFFESGTAKWHALVSFEERSSLSSRMMIWQAAGKMIADHPLVGIGVGRFQEEYLAYQKYFPPYLEWAVPQPHNFPLAVWLQTGLVGLVGTALLIGYLSISLYRYFYLETDKNKKMSARLILSLLILFLLYGLIDTPYFKNDLAFLFWILIATGASLTDRSGKDAL